MTKPGTKPQGKVKIKWSNNFAYAIGLLAADGCLSKDGRHIDFTSKDKEQVLTFSKCLGLNVKVGIKLSGAKNIAYHVQFGDVLFYYFLQNIGLTPAKSKTITHVRVPRKYFRDFLRGLFDGDGCSFGYYDPVFRNSFRFYISFASASLVFMEWLKNMIRTRVPVTGYISRTHTSSYVQLKFSKTDAQKIARFMYWDKQVPYLQRKYLKIQRAMRIIGRDTSEW